MKEKTVDEMFEELGYEKDKEYSTIYVERYKKDNDNTYYFYLTEKHFYKSGEYDALCDDITIQELQAINKKVEELGWIK